MTLRATVPHILGIGIGFPFMIFMVGLFLGEVFQQSAQLQLGVQIIGVVILLWMAWRTATAGGAGTADARQPFTFWQSAAFQWVNPKGWTFAIGVTAQFVAPDRPWVTALICGGAFMAVGFGSAFVWAFAGLLNGVDRKFKRNSAGVTNSVAHALGQTKVYSIARRQIAARLRYSNDRLAGLKLPTGETEVHVSFNVNRGAVGIVHIVEPKGATKRAALVRRFITHGYSSLCHLTPTRSDPLALFDDGTQCALRAGRHEAAFNPPNN